MLIVILEEYLKTIHTPSKNIEIIKDYYGLFGRKSHSIEEIAKKYIMSKARTKEIIAKTLGKIRNLENNKEGEFQRFLQDYEPQSVFQDYEENKLFFKIRCLTKGRGL